MDAIFRPLLIGRLLIALNENNKERRDGLLICYKSVFCIPNYFPKELDWSFGVK